MLFLSLFIFAANGIAQEHGPRAGKILKISDIVIEVVNRENNAIEIYVLGTNWGDLNIGDYEIGATVIRGGTGKKLNCESYLSGLKCDIPKGADISKDKLAIEVYKNQKRIGDGSILFSN